MKIKIKDFNGIYTNNDENDNRLELVTESENFKHKRGFLEIDPRNLTTESDLPDPTGDVPGYAWEWETGIYTTLSSDMLSTRDNPIPGKHDVLVLIAKVLDGSTYHRMIYMKDITQSSIWYDMCNNGNYIKTSVGNTPIIDIVNHEDNVFDNSAFSTDLDGNVHFQVEDGRLKLYFPHDTFWMGKIDRLLYVRDDRHRWPTGTSPDITHPTFNYEEDYWYIDRIVDDWKHNKQNVRILDQDNISQLDWAPWNETGGVQCAKGTPGAGTTRRTGILYDAQLNTEQTFVIDHKDVTFSEPHDMTVRQESSWANIRCFRTNLKSRDTGVGIHNPFGDFGSDPSIWIFALDSIKTEAAYPALDDPGDQADWPITGNPGSFANIFVYLPIRYGYDAFKLSSDADWSTIPSYSHYNAGEGYWWNGANHQVINQECWSISLEDLLANEIAYGGNLTPADIGWETGENEFSIVVTAVLDEREEIPISAKNFDEIPDDKYVIDVKNVIIPWDINKRITRIRFYHQLKDDADYEMVKDFDLLSTESSIEDFNISTNDYDAVYFSANTGFLWNFYEHPAMLRIVQGWKDFVTESGISIGISTRDEVAIYHSTFGGGNLMPNLVYDDDRLPVTGVSELTAVANADGRLMAFTPHTSYVIKAEEIAGVIAFRFEDTVEVGVKDKFDVANIQGGVLVHTRHGIYITNGYETRTMSEAIDDIVEANYATGRVYYNRYKHEIYYKPTNSEDLYRFRMRDAVWEHLNKTVTPSEQQSEHEATE